MEPRGCSFSLGQQVNYPAPASVGRVGVATVVEDVRVIALGVLKSIGQDRHPVKGTVGVNASGECDDI